ncbi:MAG: aldehyde dehydrogenase [Candidatus Aenigmarchaeota archaeon]|nr:aldehyde dehydrogenase [Candidatus Aenigmarchaeota archaeon]
METLLSINPSRNYEVNGEVKSTTVEEIKNKVHAANKAKQEWKEFGIKKRIKLLHPIYEGFKLRQKEIASLITKEMGKTIDSAEAEASNYISEFKWFMDNAPAGVADEVTHKDEKSIHKIVYEPLGSAAVITPWNFPFGMFIWGTIPNLIVGNTVVAKMTKECPLLSKLVEDVMTSHELPKGVFSMVYGKGSEVGKILAESDVNLIWFTGSTKIGKMLYKIAAEKFIKVILEMGGSNPCIVFDDVDISEAVPIIYDARFYNAGQVCDAVKRLIVHESIFDELVNQLKEYVESKTVGDPMEKNTDIGSLVAERQQILIQKQVDDARKRGANIIIGGKAPQDLKGAYYEPTIITNVKKDMRVWNEEVFGPVLPVVPFKTENEAVQIANDTPYGLGSRVLSKDLTRARRVASRIEAGTVEINKGNRWLPCNPFGGYKESGMGREHGVVGFRELCQIKVISE